MEHGDKVSTQSGRKDFDLNHRSRAATKPCSIFSKDTCLVLWRKHDDGTYQEVTEDNTPVLRCEPDPFNPRSIICIDEFVKDQRAAVSHFFGRNKKATASIPNWCQTMMCRKHYQESQYRNGKKGRWAMFQCGMIQLVIENMSRVYWRDDIGNMWPLWPDFVLQVRAGAYANGAVLDIPEWLIKMCSKASPETRHESREYPNGVKCDFHQLLLIVERIKDHCRQHDAKLPEVEALPITIGAHDQEHLRNVKLDLSDAERQKVLAHLQIRQANDRKADQQVLIRARNMLKEADETYQAAQNAYHLAKIDFESSKHTIPPTRQIKRKTMVDEQGIATDERSISRGPSRKQRRLQLTTRRHDSPSGPHRTM